MYGCWLSKAEGEVIKTLVRRRGGEVVDRLEDADVVVVHTCAVRGDTERRMFKRIRELEELRKVRGYKLVISGCLVNVRPATISKLSPEASLVEASRVEEMWRAIESKGRERVIRSYSGSRSILPEYAGGVRYIVPIQTGCIGRCAFCIEPIARGPARSYPEELILERVREAVRKGAKEVYLTGQDVACYGVDTGSSLPSLLSRILEEVDGEYFIRLGMMEPSLVKEFASELAPLYRDRRVYEYLHLPLQSGSNKVLELMRRRYTVEEYEAVVREFRRRSPELNLATDMIVGFPGEGEREFEESMAFLEKIRPDKVHVARYTIRPFTEGSLMEQVPEPVKKRRSKSMSELALRIAYEKNSKYVGKRLEVLVNDSGPKGGFAARTKNYKMVILDCPGLKLGEVVEARIVGATPVCLLGEVVS